VVAADTLIRRRIPGRRRRRRWRWKWKHAGGNEWEDACIAANTLREIPDDSLT